MTQIEDLIAAVGIRTAERADVPFFVAIDGHSAAGKSTFSRALTQAWPDVALVETDDFYRVMDAEERFALDAAGGYESYYARQRLRIEVLEPLKAFRPARFQIYDWGQNRLGAWREIQASAMVVVEGCYSARPEFDDLIDFVVLVDTDSRLRELRQAERGDASVDWLLRWEAAERFYIETTRLHERAQMTVVGS